MSSIVQHPKEVIKKELEKVEAILENVLAVKNNLELLMYEKPLGGHEWRTRANSLILENNFMVIGQRLALRSMLSVEGKDLIGLDLHGIMQTNLNKMVDDIGGKNDV